MKTRTGFKKFLARRKKQLEAFMKRRPHRSFRMTRRRDYIRPLELPGNIRFTHEVTKFFWKHKRTFLSLAAVYVVLYSVAVGIQSQDYYSTLSDTLNEIGGEVVGGNIDAFAQAGLLFASIASGSLNGTMTETQQMFIVLIVLLVWLATVWLTRNIMAGHKVKLRDGIYNSGAPLFSTVLIALLIAVQLLPVAIALLGYNAATATGLITGGGAPAMLFWIGIGLLGVLSLYWITSSLFAMIIITLPGMYPFRAIKTAGDLMVGRRVKILLRWLWMALVVVIATAIVLLPIIFLDYVVKTLWPETVWVPVIPVAVPIWTSIVLVWVAIYVYMLYRKVVDYVPSK